MLGFLGILATGCVTGGTQKNRGKETKVDVAPQSPGSETLKPSAGMAPLVLAPVPDSQIAEFASRHALSVAGLTPADEQLLRRMPNKPQPGSIHEAALVLGVVKSMNPVNTNKQDFEESDLSESSGGDAGGRTRNSAPGNNRDETAPSLEKISLQRGIDLPGAVAVNPFLQGATVIRLISMAAEKGGNSQAFQDRLKSAINKQISEWRGLAARYGTAGESNPEPSNAVNQTDQNDLSASPNPTIDSAAIVAGTGAVHDLHSSDVVLNEAIRLANEGQWEKAIVTLQRIQRDSPLFQSSREKIQDFSNTAVRDMRLQAAKAFAAANQANDTGTRVAYLQKAKDLLESAIEKYPDATQLGTVRENLTVINRDLDYLKSK